MHILLTGGTGFIGQHLVAKLAKQHQVTVLSRDTARAKRILPAGVSVTSSLNDITDFSQLDAIINLAGEPIADKRWTKKQKQRIENSRWKLTQALVARINQCDRPPSVFISGSAIGYYGRQGSNTVTEREHTIHHEFSHELCARWESIAMEAQSPHTRVCLLRTGIVLGRGFGALKKMELPFLLGLGGKIGSGKQMMSWIHIQDMVNAILWLLTNPSSHGAYNVTAPNPVNNATFVKALGLTLHRPTLLSVPAFALQLLMGESAELLLTGQKVIPQRLKEEGFRFGFPEINHAFSEIYAPD